MLAAHPLNNDDDGSWQAGWLAGSKAEIITKQNKTKKIWICIKISIYSLLTGSSLITDKYFIQICSFHFNLPYRLTDQSQISHLLYPFTGMFLVMASTLFVFTDAC